MKLKEFVLWGFKLKLKDSRKFTLFNRSVCAHFERHFQSINTDSIYRVAIKLSEGDERDGATEESSSVLKYYKAFDFNKFYDMDEMAKKKLMLDTLYDSLIDLCDKFGWLKTPFNEAYKMVLKEHFINTYSHKRKMSRSRKFVAEIVCHHESSKFDCYIEVRNKEGIEVFNKLVFSEEPDEFSFNGLMGDIKWISNDTLVYLKKDRTEIERFQFQVQKKIDDKENI